MTAGSQDSSCMITIETSGAKISAVCTTLFNLHPASEKIIEPNKKFKKKIKKPPEPDNEVETRNWNINHSGLSNFECHSIVVSPKHLLQPKTPPHTLA